MPNHVENRLKIIGDKEKILKVKDFLKSKWNDGTERNIDFNKITQMPKWVFHNDLRSKDEEKYGKENCWLDWSLKNWGTKWNAYESNLEDEEDTIRFSTAGNGVPELITKLGRIFEDIEFEYAWASEDFGYCTGLVKFKGLDKFEYIPEGGTKEAYDLASEIRKETLKQHCINENYEYDESLED